MDDPCWLWFGLGIVFGSFLTLLMSYVKSYITKRRDEQRAQYIAAVVDELDPGEVGDEWFDDSEVSPTRPRQAGSITPLP